MSEISSPPGRWHYGLHPDAAGMRVISLARIVLQLGEALRLEMEDPDGSTDQIHLQYYIDTELGPWAMWVSTTGETIAADEAAIKQLAPPNDDE